MKNLVWIVSVILLAGAVVFFAGCKEKEEPMAPEGHQYSDMNMEQGTQQAEQDAKQTLAKADEAVPEQKVCPVMGNPIDQNVFIEYQGKKVYFCCPDCIKKFKENPEKYLSKLPQFQQPSE